MRYDLKYPWPGKGYPPGSLSALDAGCRCPVLDNAHGLGMNGDWWVSSSCKLHAGKDAPWGDPRYPWDLPDPEEEKHECTNG